MKLLKLLKFLISKIINIVLLSILFGAMFIFISQTPEKQAQFLAELNERTPFDIYGVRTKVRYYIRKVFVKSDIQVVNESVAKLSHLLNENGGHFEILDINCGLPEAQPDKPQENRKIYQWKDKYGRVHFGDEGNATSNDISEKYAIEKKFDLSIISVDAILPLFLRDKITIHINKIFSILSDSINANQLSQVLLNLKLFGSKKAFDLYIDETAPGMRGAIGFYRANENEAAIWNQPNETKTLEVIRHESTHVIIASIYGLSPIWLNEGLSGYFEKLEVEGLAATIYPNAYMTKILKKANASSPLDIREQMEKPAINWQNEDVEMNYAKAWSIIYFLMSSEQGKSRLNLLLSKMAEDRCQPIESIAFFEENYSGGVAQMNQDWQAWLNQTKYTPHRY